MGITQFPKERIHLPRAIDSTWTSDLKESFLTVDELLKSGFVNESDFFKLKSISDSYRIRVSKYYASLIKEKGDPIWLQAIPSIHEIDLPFPNWAKEFSIEAFGKPSPWIDDAIGDIEKLSAPRLTHRYDNRAIVHISSMCSTYCRFCFRKTHLNDSDRTLYDGSP